MTKITNQQSVMNDLELIKARLIELSNDSGLGNVDRENLMLAAEKINEAVVHLCS